MVNVSFLFSLICWHLSTVFRSMCSWIDPPHIYRTDLISQYLCLGSSLIRPICTCVMVYHRALYLALLCSQIIAPQSHHWSVFRDHSPLLCLNSIIDSIIDVCACMHWHCLLCNKMHLRCWWSFGWNRQYNWNAKVKLVLHLFTSVNSIIFGLGMRISQHLI